MQAYTFRITTNHSCCQSLSNSIKIGNRETQIKHEKNRYLLSLNLQASTASPQFGQPTFTWDAIFVGMLKVLNRWGVKELLTHPLHLNSF